MIGLETLKRAMATVIVAYHDIKAKDTIVKESEPKYKFYEQLQQKGLNAYLSEVITVCAKIDSSRKPFLEYLLHQILWIDELTKRQAPLNDKEVENISQQIGVMLTDFDKLLSTSKLKSYDVTCYTASSEAKTTLMGLYVEGHFKFNSGYCDSGSLLNDEIMKPLHLADKPCENEIKIEAHQLVEDFQNTLLIKQYKATIAQLTTSNNALTGHLTQANSQIGLLDKKLDDTAKQLLSVEEQLTKAKSEYATLESKLTALEVANNKSAQSKSEAQSNLPSSGRLLDRPMTNPSLFKAPNVRLNIGTDASVSAERKWPHTPAPVKTQGLFQPKVFFGNFAANWLQTQRSKAFSYASESDDSSSDTSPLSP